MKFEAVELRRIRLPLVTPFETSFGVQSERDVLLLHFRGPEGDGWGECVAMSEPTYSSEYTDGAHQVIVSHLLPRLFAAGEVTAESVGPILSAVKGHPMAKAALEMAVLDAQLLRDGVSLKAYLGGTRDRVPSGVSVGIAPTIGELLDQIGAYLAEG